MFGLGVLLAGLALAPLAKASSIVIIPTFDSTITSDLDAALIESTINQAIAFYEANISTNITVNIDFAEMTSGLGQSSTFVNTISYVQYRAALAAHSSGDATDTSALIATPVGVNNPVNGNANVEVATANLRALGFGTNVAIDSNIGLNTGITNYTGKAFNASFYSLLAVVEHEMDEALGLGSSLDSGSTTGIIRPEDLFRFSAPGVRNFTTSSSAVSYLSVDGGVTNLVGFNQVGPPGSSDYGDWAASGSPRVQDAFGTQGATPVYGPEAVALDAIGYNYSSATPEPATLGLFGASLAMLAWYRRKRA